MEMLIILALAFGAMYLMTSRTRKQQREAADFRANLEVGQEVMTGSGLYGTIVDVDGDVITLESTPGNQTRWIRAAIAKLVVPTDGVVEDDEEYADEDEVDDDAPYEEGQDEQAQYGAGEYDATPGAEGHVRYPAEPGRAVPASGSGAERFDVPDDLSALDERRTDDGPDRR